MEPVEQFLLHHCAHLMVHITHITDMRFNVTCCTAAVWMQFQGFCEDVMDFKITGSPMQNKFSRS